MPRKKTKLKINLFNEASWEEFFAEYDNINKKYAKDKLEIFLSRIAEKGVEIAKTRVLTLGATFTMDLYNSLHAVKKGDLVFAVVTDSNHCAFVEFGTGQMGEEGPYPYPFPKGVAWEYNIGETIFEIDDGEYGWFYPSSDGRWYFTQGMPARPFMYETGYELEREIGKIAKEVFGNGPK